MAIHDTWHFENAPQGVNLGVAAGGTTYNGNTIYSQYTGNVGQIMTLGSANATVTADGFLTFPAVSAAAAFLIVPLNAVQDWTNSTQYWIGFRTKLNAAFGAQGWLLIMGSNTSNSSYTALLSEAQMTSANLNTVGVEHYIEVFMDRNALTFQVYCDGLLINSGALSSAVLNSGNGYLEFGANVTSGAGTGSRGFRDFYFLDVDATYTGRLGPIRAKAATVTAASGSEWVANGAANLLAALNTPIGTGSMTPNVLAPVDKQALTLSLSSPVTDSGSKILGVTPGLSFGSLSGSVANVAAGFQDGSNPLVNAGTFLQTNAGGTYNQKLPLVKTGPNGQKWTAAELNQSQYVLTPQ